MSTLTDLSAGEFFATAANPITVAGQNEPNELPAELRGRPPRDLPADRVESAKRRHTRYFGWFCLSVGVGLAVIHAVGWAKSLSGPFPPLAYAEIAALAFSLLGIGAWIASHFVLGDWRYVRDGVGCFGTVVQIDRVPTVTQNGMVVGKAFDVAVTIDKYESLPPILRTIRVGESSADKVDRNELRFGLGDRIALVYLRDDFEKSLRIYECLDFIPGGGMRNREDIKKASLITQVLGALAIIAMLGGCMWNLCNTNHYDVIHGIPWRHCAVVGAVAAVLGLVQAMFLLRILRRQHGQVTVDANGVQNVPLDGGPGRGIQALVAFGSFVMPALLLFQGAETINAVFDRSTPPTVLAQVVDAETTTFNGVFRTYSIALQIDEPYRVRHQMNVSRSVVDRVASVAQRGQLPICEIAISHGVFGWPYVKGLHVLNGEFAP